MCQELLHLPVISLIFISLLHQENSLLAFFNLIVFKYHCYCLLSKESISLVVSVMFF
jgi:hypothetical protein